MSFCSFSTFQSSMQRGKLLIPAPPTNIISTVIDSSSIRVAFTAPNEIITSYTVKSSPGNLTGTGSTSPITVNGLTTNTAYTFTVTATSSFGTSTASNASSSKKTLTIAPTITSVILSADSSSVDVVFTPFSGSTTTAGLYFTIYDGYFADSMTFTSTSALKTTASSTGYTSNISSISAGTNSAVSNNSLEFFTVEWIGLFLANVTGTWTFFTSSDDGSFLWIGANATSGYTTTNATVQNGGLHSTQERSGTVVLTSGVYYPIRILYGDNTADNTMTVSFTPPAGTKTTNGTGYYYNPSISYNVTSTPDSLTRTGLTSPITVSGLSSSNTIYTFTMTATNLGGTSVSSIVYANGSASGDYNLKFSFGTSTTPVSNTFDDTGTKQFYSLQQGRVNVLDSIRGWVFTGLNLLINSPNYTTTASFTRSCWTYGTESNLGNKIMASASCSMDITSTSTYVATLNGSIITDPLGNRGYNTWVHQAVTYNGTTFTMYINGVSVGSTTPTAYTGTDTYLYLLSLSNTAYFKGLSDNFLSYTRALTATEIYTIYTHESTLGTTTVPGAPTIGTPTIVNVSSARVSFTAPSGNGTITGYTVTSTPGGLIGTGTSSPITVSGLSGNTTYTFTITATNSGGTSVSSSASTSITTLPNYTFRVKSTTSVVPTTVDGYTLSNTSVAMVNDATRGFVFSFGTNKSLSINLATPLNSTKTFWLSSSTPQSSDGNVFSTAKMPIYFNSTTLLKATVNFGGSPVANVVSTIAQTITWKFYAITTTATTTTMYVNGNVVASASVSWTGDTSAMYFGSFTTGANNYVGSMDDIIFYSLILTPAEIQTLYTSTLL